MTFNHKSTFLRSALLEDPLSLGDLLSPQDVLRIESEYPELFTPLEIPRTTKNTNKPLPGKELNEKRFPGIAKLSRDKGCERSRCQPPTSQIESKMKPKEPKEVPTVAPAKLPRPRSSPAARPDDMSRKLKSLAASLSSPNLKIEELLRKRSKEIIKPVSERYNHASNTGVLKSVPTLIRKKTHVRPGDLISQLLNEKKSVQRSPQSVRFQFGEDSLGSLDNNWEKTEASDTSSDSKGSDEVRFQVKLPSRKDKGDSLSSGSLPEQNIPDFIRVKSRGTVDPKVKEEREARLEEDSVDRCEQLLLAKILATKYEKEGKFKKVPPVHHKKRVRISEPVHEVLLENHEKQNKDFEEILARQPSLLKKIMHELIHAEVVQILSEEKENTVKITKNVAVSTDVNTSELERKEPDTTVSEPIRTPTLTPPQQTRSKQAKHNHQVNEIVPPEKDDANEAPSVSLNTPSKTISEKLENVRKMIARHRLENDVTDCSELEDFVASEPVLKRTPGEPCITEVSTPEWPTPFSINSDNVSPEEPEKETERGREKEVKSVQLQVVPEEFENFDQSELESSLGSILEIISEGEFIRTERKSPGEISQYFSPGYKNYTDSTFT